MKDPNLLPVLDLPFLLPFQQLCWMLSCRLLVVNLFRVVQLCCVSLSLLP